MTAEQIAVELRLEAMRYLEIADMLDPPNELADVSKMALDHHQLNEEAEEFYAPYGYKADGTPRRRPPLSPESRAKATATKAAKRAANALQAHREEVRLDVISSTTPTEDELKDRRVAYTTEEPA